MFLMPGSRLSAQLSPGDLADVHAQLEGISKCTQCHILGDKVSNDKCLQCHAELKLQVSAGKGYHASVQVKGKQCASCHNDHHGRKFQIIKFTRESFDHNLTGFRLLGAHAKKLCADCHKQSFITSPAIKNKKYTFLGLGNSCVNCHADYHQNALSRSCDNCHGMDAFKPAANIRMSPAKNAIKQGSKTDSNSSNLPESHLKPARIVIKIPTKINLALIVLTAITENLSWK